MKGLIRKIWRFMRIRFLRIYIKINGSIVRDEQLSQTQKHAFSIFKKMANTPETTLQMAPNSGTIYLALDDIFAILDNYRLNIINGKYSYDISLTVKQYDSMKAFFRRKLEGRCKNIEKEVIERTNKSLVNILNSIDQSFTKGFSSFDENPTSIVDISKSGSPKFSQNDEEPKINKEKGVN